MKKKSVWVIKSKEKAPLGGDYRFAFVDKNAISDKELIVYSKSNTDATRQVKAYLAK